MRNQIVILAAGKGTRMNQSELPKVLVMLNQKPIILHLLEEVAKVNQLAKPVIVVGYKADQVRQVLGEDYVYAVQDQQLGTGHAVMCAERKIIGENILVLNGDIPFLKAESMSRLMRLHHEKNANISMFTTVVDDFVKYPAHYYYGRIIRDGNEKIVAIVERKDATPEQLNIREVNLGIYMFNTKWLFANTHKLENKNAQGEYYLTDMIQLAIKDGQEIFSLPIDPLEGAGINSPEELVQAEKLI